MRLAIVAADAAGREVRTIAESNIGIRCAAQDMAAVWIAVMDTCRENPPSVLELPEEVVELEYRHPWFPAPVARLAIDHATDTYDFAYASL